MTALEILTHPITIFVAVLVLSFVVGVAVSARRNTKFQVVFAAPLRRDVDSEPYPEMPKLDALVRGEVSP